MRGNLLWQVGVLVSLFACGVQQPPVEADVADEDIAQSEGQIIQGKDDPGDPAIIAILAAVPGKEGQSLCTGTLISSTVVLTAAHCVNKELLGGDATFTVLTDWNLRDGIADADKHAVKTAVHDPEFDPNAVQNGHDIAIIVLQEPITNITPIPWNDEPLDSSLTGSQVRIVGYGLSKYYDKEGTSAGTKRQANTKLKKFDDKLVVTGGFLQPVICNGDSGGPILANINGQETIIGVNSYGIIFCVGSGNSTRVDTYKDWVKDNINELSDSK